jgi:UDP-N-acetylmuramate dehydrogenase
VLTRAGEQLQDWTTLHLGGPARTFVTAGSREELYAEVERCDRSGEPVLVLGGGSNLVVADDGFDGTVVRVETSGVHVSAEDCAGVEVTVEAGEDWDRIAARAVAEEWIGFEALAGIPGTVGAVPIQNVGAYGQEVSQTVSQVHAFDRVERRTRTIAAADCGFGYRSSRFKREPARFVVGAVTFQLRPGSLGAPIRYAELARALGVDVGDRMPSADVRAAVLALRKGKGMVLDPADHDTWSAGSFFTNPFVDPDRLPDGAPAFPQPDGTVKTSAAWLIEHAGFGRGYGNQRVRLSGKHTLALTNRGAATTADLLELAREVRSGVLARFGIELHPEPVLVGCSL